VQQKDGRKSYRGSAASSSQHSKGKARATDNPDDADAGNEDADGAPAGGDPDDSDPDDDSDSDSDSDDEGNVARPSFNKDKSVEATMHDWLALQPTRRKYAPKDVRHNINVSTCCIFYGVLIRYHRDFVVL